MKSDRFDVLERYGRLFEAPQPSFQGFLRLRDRKRRSQRIAAGVVGVAVFVAAAAGIWVATNGPFEGTEKPGSGQTITPQVPEAPDVPEGAGLTGLPPEGATPSLPKEGELVLYFVFGHTSGDPGRFMFHMYADGRLIWERIGDIDTNSTGLIEQRLTPEGVELVRSEVLATGLFGQDLYLSATGLTYGFISVRDGGRLVRVTWGDSTEPMEGERMTPTPEQVSALQRLDARVEDPGLWLPASAWVDQEMKPYVPSSYEVCYENDQGVSLDRVLASLPAPAEDLLRSRERTHGRYGPFIGAEVEFWCSRLTTEESRGLAEILDGAGRLEMHSEGSHIIYFSGRRGPAPHVTISFSPVLPHGPSAG